MRRNRSCFVVGEISRVTVWFVSGGHISSTPAVINREGEKHAHNAVKTNARKRTLCNKNTSGYTDSDNYYIYYYTTKHLSHYFYSCPGNTMIVKDMFILSLNTYYTV